MNIDGILSNAMKQISLLLNSIIDKFTLSQRQPTKVYFDCAEIFYQFSTFFKGAFKLKFIPFY
jgi:hypothetical protein